MYYGPRSVNLNSDMETIRNNSVVKNVGHLPEDCEIHET